MTSEPFNELLLQRLSEMSMGLSRNSETLAEIKANQGRNTNDLGKLLGEVQEIRESQTVLDKRVSVIEKKPGGITIDPRSAKDWLTKLGPFILVMTAAIAKCFGLELPLP